ncbi:MAG: GlxA family transcriptional regulator [Imperialibacter sp.]|uniref:GlxA family transcriptional regulator n=1 Tax=Imperialibacter sp. TaxID=2038411 RepID=UPI003A8A31D7
MNKIAFIIPPTVELLDLAGPVQVFTEAKFYGFALDLEFFIYQHDPVCTSGLGFGKVAHYSEAQLAEGDYVFMPGMDQNYVVSDSFGSETAFFRWLKECVNKGITVCSVCNGAFALGHAGLLNGLECTTHWRRVEALQAQFPQAKVLADRLYVKHRHVCTSAGISAGIDLSLSILEDLAGALFTQKVARGLVVYHRKSDANQQEGFYLRFRNHINANIHDLQDYLIDNMVGDTSMAKLAAVAGMSQGTLRNAFEAATGITLVNYLTQLRLELAAGA